MANIIEVSKKILSKFKTIEKALITAQPGDTIKINKGKYPENVLINKSINLIGESGVIIEGSIQIEKKVNLTLESLHIINEIAINMTESSLHLRNCHCSGDVILNNRSNTVFQNCIITPFNEGILLTKNSTAKLINTNIMESPKYSLTVNEKSKIELINCEIAKNKKRELIIDHSDLKAEYCVIEVSVRSSDSVLTISNSTLKNCYGMAIDAKKQSKVHIDKCEVSQGFLYFDGATGVVNNTKVFQTVFIQKGVVGVNANIELNHCDIFSCNSHGIMLSKQCRVTISNCDLYNNKESNVHCSESDVLIRDSKLYDSENGIFIDQSHVDVINTSISNHKLCGIHTVTKPSTIKLENTKVQQNHVKDIEETNERIFISKYNTRHIERDVLKLEKIKSIAELPSTYKEYKHNTNVLDSTVTIIPSKQQTATKEASKNVNESKHSEGILELKNLVGLTKIKTQLEDLFKLVEFNKQLTNFQLADDTSSINAEHTVLFGNPGTGKTTLAKIIGKVYKELGLLEKGHIVQVNREKLVGEYIGHTAVKTQKKIDEAMGGVLFIDEAYALTNKGANNDFGPEAIEVLLEAMENHRGKFIVIVAGYEKEMQQFLEVNPGLKSRFTQIYELEDYTPEELLQIFEALVSNKKRTISDEATQLLLEHFTDLWRQRDRYFSNARLVRNYVDRIIAAQMKRCMNIPLEDRTKEKLQMIIVEDVLDILEDKKSKKFNLPINEQLLSHTLEQLNELVGLDTVKYEIQKLVTLTRYYKEEEKDLTQLSNHFVLTGNPGTGKTQVARLLAKIYEALGVVERGELIEVSRNQLIGPYSGDTEKLIVDHIQKAMNGTLFIDEAYQLTQYGSNDSGHKVVEVLLKYMEDYRGQFNVIVAGYPDEMEQFLDSNAGLRRRFVYKLNFPDYTPNELVFISQSIIKTHGYFLADLSNQTLQDFYKLKYNRRDKTFGNAGLARNMMLEAIKNADYRVATLSKEERQLINKKEIIAEDLAPILNYFNL